ncbi:winged helix-turn-helix transcriptional regulator [Candidatus Bathyarchaeota archaeon A05DMB-2]|jgi:DNA-binding MarR family transcriptional regulator|nr:winged helix-turn-helix transcriptional regulator [Candidatus Bathyarchaeota archaeon A05DMB-2]
MALNEESLAEYVLLSVRKPSTVEYETDLEWICRTFGFLESRDKQKTAYFILKNLIEAAAHDNGLTSDELAEKLSLTRGTMVHHLNKMMKSGLVIFHEGKYKLRERSLKNTVKEIQRDVARLFEDIIEVAEAVDQTLGLVSR